ncbi:dihydrofolate reductase family protein, partial [Streptosporangium sp. NPDC001682]
PERTVSRLHPRARAFVVGTVLGQALGRAQRGAAVATQLLRAGLLDELLLFTHPAILGFGRPLFDDYDLPIDLDLLEQRSFEQGVTMHRYAIRDAREASSC